LFAVYYPTIFTVYLNYRVKLLNNHKGKTFI